MVLYKTIFSSVSGKNCFLDYHEQTVDLSACKHFCLSFTVSRPFAGKTHVEEGGNGTACMYSIIPHPLSFLHVSIQKVE